MARFPGTDVRLRGTDAERAAALADGGRRVHLELSAAELARAPRLRWVHSSAVAVETLVPARAGGARRARQQLARRAGRADCGARARRRAGARQAAAVRDSRTRRRGRLGAGRLYRVAPAWLLNGRTLGLIGLGSIGQALARAPRRSGCTSSRSGAKPDAPPVAGVSAVYGRDRLLEMLGQVRRPRDRRAAHADTDRLIDRTALAALKPGAVVINVGRAAIIDTDALIDALQDGPPGRRGARRFPEEPLPPGHPLWTAPNVILTPHTSGFRQGHWDEVIDVFARQPAAVTRRASRCGSKWPPRADTEEQASRLGSGLAPSGGGFDVDHRILDLGEARHQAILHDV